MLLCLCYKIGKAETVIPTRLPVWRCIGSEEIGGNSQKQRQHTFEIYTVSPVFYFVKIFHPSFIRVQQSTNVNRTWDFSWDFSRQTLPWGIFLYPSFWCDFPGVHPSGPMSKRLSVLYLLRRYSYSPLLILWIFLIELNNKLDS